MQNMQVIIEHCAPSLEGGKPVPADFSGPLREEEYRFACEGWALQKLQQAALAFCNVSDRVYGDGPGKRQHVLREAAKLLYDAMDTVQRESGIGRGYALGEQDIARLKTVLRKNVDVFFETLRDFTRSEEEDAWANPKA